MLGGGGKLHLYLKGLCSCHSESLKQIYNACSTQLPWSGHFGKTSSGRIRFTPNGFLIYSNIFYYLPFLSVRGERLCSLTEGGFCGTENSPTTEMQGVLQCQEMFECYSSLTVYLSHLVGIPKRPHLRKKGYSRERHML